MGTPALRGRVKIKMDPAKLAGSENSFSQNAHASSVRTFIIFGAAACQAKVLAKSPG
jgi:hypothetical protein